MSALRLLLVPTIAFVGAFLASDIAAAAQAGAAKANRIKVDYGAPKNPAHQVIYRKLKEIRALENLREFLSPFRLPRTLLVKTEGCDGESNAWFAFLMTGALYSSACYSVNCLKRSCPLYPRKQTGAVHYPMSAKGQKRHRNMGACAATFGCLYDYFIVVNPT